MTLINNSESGASVRSKLNDLIIFEARKLKDVTTLLADTNLTYTAGQDGTVTAGDIVTTEAEGFSYEVAASGATDQHVTTAGGVKLYRVAGGVIVRGSTASPSFVMGANLFAEMDTALLSSWAFDGASGFANKVGANNTSPVTGTWTNDTGYAAGQADYSAIMGGYDNIANGLATIIASQHSMVTSDADHGTIIGGSVNGILGGSYGGIFAGTNNRIHAVRLDGSTVVAAAYSLIVGGIGNDVHSANSTIVGGSNNEIDGEFSKVIAAQSSKALGNFDTVLGSNSETRKGTSGAGQRNTIGGGRFNIIDSPASPVSSTIAGGEDNEIYGSFNFLGGGDDNVIGSAGTAANYGTLSGGLTNLVSAPTAGTVGGGRSNVAAADYSTIPGGRENQTTANYAIAIGYQAVARHQSGLSLADGGFSAAGDAQTSRVLRKATTTNATLTSMPVIVVPDDTTVAFSALIVARRTDANDEGAGYRLEGVIDRNTGAATTALVGTVAKTVIGEDVAGWDVSAIANASSGGITIQVTGEASKTIRWVASCDLVEVTG